MSVNANKAYAYGKVFQNLSVANWYSRGDRELDKAAAGLCQTKILAHFLTTQ